MVKIEERIRGQIIDDTEREGFSSDEVNNIRRRTVVNKGSNSFYKGDKKEIEHAEGLETFPKSLMGSKENLLFVFILGISLALINDFLDLVLWHMANLLGATLDITVLFLFILILSFFSGSLIISTFIVIISFILEIIPIIGVIPFWTIAIAVWYGVSRKKS